MDKSDEIRYDQSKIDSFFNNSINFDVVPCENKSDLYNFSKLLFSEKECESYHLSDDCLFKNKRESEFKVKNNSDLGLNKLKIMSEVNEEARDSKISAKSEYRNLDYYFGCAKRNPNKSYSIPLLDELDTHYEFPDCKFDVDNEITKHLMNDNEHFDDTMTTHICKENEKDESENQNGIHFFKCGGNKVIENKILGESSISCSKYLSNKYKYNSETSKVDYFVYTDGACINNGRSDAMASIGVYFGESDPRNISKRIDGKQSNNCAELSAVLEAIQIIGADLRTGKTVGIVTDSEYVLKCVGRFGEKCARQGWNESIPNKWMVERLYNLANENKNCLQFYHVRSHTNKTDIHSVGNECADKLANKAIGINNEYKIHNKLKRIYLSVSYNEKDIIKKMGGNWDIKKKKWFVYNNNSNIDYIIERFAN